MVIKKSVLLSVLALGMLMQAPASATPFKVKVGKARFAVSDWFFNKESKLGQTYKTDSDHNQHWEFSSQDASCRIEDIMRFSITDQPGKNIGLMFDSPAETAGHTVACALVARAIQANASIADYSKVAAYSFAGAMATSLLNSGSSKGLAKLKPADWSRTSAILDYLAKATELAILVAGQNPEAVKSIVASFKAKTVGKDLTQFILSLNKDVNRRQRLAAIVRTFGPFFLKLTDLS